MVSLLGKLRERLPADCVSYSDQLLRLIDGHIESCLNARRFPTEQEIKTLSDDGGVPLRAVRAILAETRRIKIETQQPYLRRELDSEEQIANGMEIGALLGPRLSNLHVVSGLPVLWDLNDFEFHCIEDDGYALAVETFLLRNGSQYFNSLDEMRLCAETECWRTEGLVSVCGLVWCESGSEATWLETTELQNPWNTEDELCISIPEALDLVEDVRQMLKSHGVRGLPGDNLIGGRIASKDPLFGPWLFEVNPAILNAAVAPFMDQHMNAPHETDLDIADPEDTQRFVASGLVTFKKAKPRTKGYRPYAWAE